jgi:hypothetical protein
MPEIKKSDLRGQVVDGGDIYLVESADQWEVFTGRMGDASGKNKGPVTVGIRFDIEGRDINFVFSLPNAVIVANAFIEAIKSAHEANGRKS